MLPFLVFHWIHSYGLLMAIGFYAGWYLAARRARAFGEDPDVIGNLVLLCILAGVAGARILYFCLHKRADDSLWAIFRVWEGGLVFYGGLLAAAAAALLYLRWRRLNPWRFADICAPAIAVGQAFGRIGCFLNGCCFGGPAAAGCRLAIRFPRFLSSPAAGKLPEVLGSPPFQDHVHRNWIADAATHSLPVHPTQLYAAFSLFLIAALVIAATPYRRREGELLGLLAILHALQRFAIELVRHDTPPRYLGIGLKAGQLFALVVLVCGVGRNAPPAPARG